MEDIVDKKAILGKGQKLPLAFDVFDVGFDLSCLFVRFIDKGMIPY